MITRQELARQVAEALADLPPAQVSSFEVARRVLGGAILDAGELLALQPEIEAATEQLTRLADDSQKSVKECLQLQPQPSPRLPSGF